jgi:TolA-binding protein
LQQGDANAVKEWLQAYREAHPSEMMKGAGKGPMTGVANGERMPGMPGNLTAKGYDVSAIRSAVTSGDYKTAQTLLQEFRTAHPDTFPVPGEGACSGHMGGQRRAQNNQ